MWRHLAGAGELHALRVHVIVSSIFHDEVSIFYLSGVFIGPFDIEKLSSRDQLFILDTLWFQQLLGRSSKV